MLRREYEECVMRTIEYFDKRYRLMIDGEEYPVRFCIGIYKELGIDELTEVPAYLDKAGGVFKAAVTLFNENIKRYNREYNGNEKPIRYKELVEITDNTDKLAALGKWVRYIYIISQVIPKKAQERAEKEQIKPTVNRLIASGVSVLGLGYSEIMGLSLRELYEIVEAYNAMRPSGKNEGDDLETDFENEGACDHTEMRLG